MLYTHIYIHTACGISDWPSFYLPRDQIVAHFPLYYVCMHNGNELQLNKRSRKGKQAADIIKILTLLKKNVGTKGDDKYPNKNI